MNIEISTCRNFLRIRDYNLLEFEEIKKHFTKKVNNWFVIKQKSANAKIEERFISNEGVFSTGLWKEMIEFCNIKNYPLYLPQDFSKKVFDEPLTIEYFSDYIQRLFKGAKIDGNDFFPYKYQIASAYNLLKYKRGVIDISTSGGKTLICYLVFKYLLDHDVNNTLIFMPSEDLLKQTIEKFLLYDSSLSKANQKPWRYLLLSSKSYVGKKKLKEIEELGYPNLIMGTYQSVCNKEQKLFDSVRCVLGDEIHSITASSVKTIYERCNKADYKLGVSGTPHRKKDYNDFTSQSYIGPILYTLTSKELIHTEKKATPVRVVAKEMIYKPDEDIINMYKLRSIREEGDVDISKSCLEHEQDYVRNHLGRFYEIIKDIEEDDGNTLVIFSDVKTGYGNKIYQYLLQHSTKSVYYVDGDTPTDERNFIIEQFETDESNRSVIVATHGTFSQGIDFKRIAYIALVESVKSERIVAQLLGRGMRLFNGKTEVILRDYQDNLNYIDTFEAKSKQWDENKKRRARTSMLKKQSTTRNSVYKDRGFPLEKVVHNVSSV